MSSNRSVGVALSIFATPTGASVISADDWINGALSSVFPLISKVLLIATETTGIAWSGMLMLVPAFTLTPPPPTVAHTRLPPAPAVSDCPAAPDASLLSVIVKTFSVPARVKTTGLLPSITPPLI